MTTLTKVENFQDHAVDAIISGVDSINMMSKKLMQTKHYAKMGEEGIFAICMAAKSNGISISDALNGELYFVQGRVGMGYEAMNKYIRLAGHSVIIKHLDEKSCTLIGKRKDTGDTAEITFDMNDAKRAGKTYDKHPKPMLFARALSMLKRFLFPDVLTKIYEKGELEDISSEVSVADVKPLYMEEKEEKISMEQNVELSMILAQCSPVVQENFKAYLQTKFNINELEDLPVAAYEQQKKVLTIRSLQEQQKKLAEAEMENVKVEEVVQ